MFNRHRRIKRGPSRPAVRRPDPPNSIPTRWLASPPHPPRRVPDPVDDEKADYRLIADALERSGCKGAMELIYPNTTSQNQ